LNGAGGGRRLPGYHAASTNAGPIHCCAGRIRRNSMKISRSIVILCILGLPGGGVLSWAQNPPLPRRGAAQAPAPRDLRAELELARETLSKYYESQKLLSKEKTDWKLGKEILTDRIGMMKSELDAIKQKTIEEEGKITDADKQRDELVQQNDALKEVGKLQEERVVDLEKRMISLVKRLPGPLESKLRPLIGQIPQGDVETKQSLSQRYATVMGIMNEVNKFNMDIVLATERRDLGEGLEAEVETLYFGLGHAYYAGSGETAKHAGFGYPSPTGYVWTAAPDAAGDIARAIGMQKNEQVPGFIGLPITIK
jgi:hypothetical protein